MNNHLGTPANGPKQNYVVACSLAWGVSIVAATWILESTPLDGVAAWAVAIVPSLVALVALVAYLRFLRQSDELIQKINLEALALGFAVGVLLALGYPLLEQAGAPQLTGNVIGAVMLMVFALAQMYANLRYLRYR